jgi:hypothetical protein
VDIVREFGVAYAMPYENRRPIFICRGLRRSLYEVWVRLRRMNKVVTGLPIFAVSPFFFKRPMMFVGFIFRYW